MMKQSIKSMIAIVLAVIIVIFTILFISFFKDIGTEAFKNSNATSININSEIEDYLQLLTAEGEYEEIITRKETWIMGINSSVARVKVKGSIKVGSQLIDVKKEEDRYIITLSEPGILQHDIKKQGQWETIEGILNEFDAAVEGEIFQSSKRDIEDRLLPELRSESIKNNKLAIYTILGKFANKEISEENCEIIISKINRQDMLIKCIKLKAFL